MSWDVSTQTNPTASKEYHCQASDWIENSGLCDEDFDAEDAKTIAKARSEGWMILPGTKYVKITGKWDGDFQTFRAREDLDYICHSYELYCE